MTGRNSTASASRPAVRRAYHVCVWPSCAGRPIAPQFTTSRPPGSARDQCRPVCEHTITSVSCASHSHTRKSSEHVLSHRNSFCRRGEPWHSSTRRPPSVSRVSRGSARNHARDSSLTRAAVKS